MQIYWKNIKVISSIVILTLASIGASAYAVPAIPNKAVLMGTVKEYCLTSSDLKGMVPQQTLLRLTIVVEKVDDLKGQINFLKGKEGQTVTFYSQEKKPIEIYGQRIKAVAEYQGDERGGLFWIKEIEIIK